MTVPDEKLVPFWLRGWAMLTVATTLVLLALGGVVTTFKVGMADAIWPTAPWHLALLDYTVPNPGLVIEHTHRLAGYVVGLCVIVLAIGLGMQRAVPSLRWLGVVALLCVIAQGLLGGFRVVLNEIAGTDLAALHGVFAQVVLGLMVAIMVLASRKAQQAALEPEDHRRLRNPLRVLVGLLLLQLVWGAILRHADRTFAARLHLLTAFAVVGVAVWVVLRIRETEAARRSDLARASLRGPVRVLEVLLALQLLLGVEAWFGKFAYGLYPELQPPLTIGQAIVRTAHQLTGACLLASAVALAVLARSREHQPASRTPKAEIPSAPPQIEPKYLTPPQPAGVAAKGTA
jgi:cytochrome c oxidase assembly protein subunit 15